MKNFIWILPKKLLFFLSGKSKIIDKYLTKKWKSEMKRRSNNIIKNIDLDNIK